jgi:hypothetical protein
MSKSVAVLFSGGLDSTYLVWKNLKEGNRVYPIYIEISNNNEKVLLEKNRINLLFELFYEEFGFNINRIETILSVNVNHCCYGELMFKQMPIWIFGLLFYQERIDEIQIGYVGNDDALSYLDDIQKIYNSYKTIYANNKLVPLKFPLKKAFKVEMAHELPSKYFNLIVSCENPTIINSNEKIIKYKPCCECTACKRIINSDYYGMNSFPDYYREEIKKNKIKELQNIGYKIFNENGDEIKRENWECPKREPFQLKLDFNWYSSLSHDDYYNEKNDIGN